MGKQNCVFLLTGSLQYNNDDGATPFEGDCKNLNHWILSFSKKTHIVVTLSHDGNVHHSVYLERKSRKDEKKKDLIRISKFDENSVHFDLEVDGKEKEKSIEWDIVDFKDYIYSMIITRYAINDESTYSLKISGNEEFKIKEIDGKEIKKAILDDDNKEEEEVKKSACCLLI